MEMPPRVLLVDDARDITRFLRTALETLGLPLRVDEALSGEEALLALRDQAVGHVDVLVADLRLPGMSGLQLLERARRLSPRTRSLVISGAADGDMRREAERLGAAAVLDKPIELKAFLETVTRLLARATMPEAAAQPAAPADAARPARRSGETEPDAALRRELDAVLIARWAADGQWRTRLAVHAEAALGDPSRMLAALQPGHWHVVETVDALLVAWREDDALIVAQFSELTSARLAAIRRRVRREPPRPATTRVPVVRHDPTPIETPAPLPDAMPLADNGLLPEPTPATAPLPIATRPASSATALSENDLTAFERALTDLGKQDVDAFWNVE